jgi:hypothetical protein
VELHIGVTHSPKEISIDLGDDADRDAIVSEIETVLSEESRVLWLTDRRGRKVGIPAAKVAYVEIGGAEERRIGFGAP